VPGQTAHLMRKAKYQGLCKRDMK